MIISIHLSRNHVQFLKIIVKYIICTYNYSRNTQTNFYTFTQGTYKFSKHYDKIREKIYKFPYNYLRNIQMFNKIQEKAYKKLKYFIT